MDRAVHRSFGRFGRALAPARAAGFATVLGMVAVATPVFGQVRGLPVYNAGVPRGLVVAGDVGLPNDAAGGGLGYGVTGRAGLGLFGISATIAAYNPDGSDGAKAAVGGTVNYRVLGGPLIPLAVTLQGGVGYYQPGGLQPGGTSAPKEWHIPVGVGFALTVPNPALAIKPWLAPRVDITRTTTETSLTSTTTTDTHFGLSGGIELNFLNGFGLHAAYDLVTAGSAKPGVFGVGAHYAFRLPLP